MYLSCQATFELRKMIQVAIAFGLEKFQLLVLVEGNNNHKRNPFLMQIEARCCFLSMDLCPFLLKIMLNTFLSF